jgi:opacity protein-like surface antigen
MKLKHTLVAISLIAAATGGTGTAFAGELDGPQFTAALVASNNKDKVADAAASTQGTSKVITLGAGYFVPVNDGLISLGGMAEATVDFGDSSAKSFGFSLQPGYYIQDDLVVYGKLGFITENRTYVKNMEAITLGVGMKYKVSPNMFVGGELEQLNFKAPNNVSAGVSYPLTETRVGFKIGFIFE